MSDVVIIPANQKVARAKRVLILAILSKGPIESKSGRCASILFELIKLNGGKMKTSQNLAAMLKEFNSCVTVTMTNKRTYKIVLNKIPPEYVNEVEDLIPNIVLEAPVVMPPAVQQEVSQRSSDDDMDPSQAIVVADPDDVAFSILKYVAEVFNQQGFDPDTWRRTRDHLQQMQKLQETNRKLIEDLARKETTISQLGRQVAKLQGEKEQLAANLRNAIQDKGGVIREQVDNAIATFMSQTPNARR